MYLIKASQHKQLVNLYKQKKKGDQHHLVSLEGFSFSGDLDIDSLFHYKWYLWRRKKIKTF